MKPIANVETLRRAEAALAQRVGHDALVRAAGFAVTLEAQSLLGTLYGRRVAVLCGPGTNGRDGRVSARELERRGAKVTVVEALEHPTRVGGVDLIIDAAFGVGCSRPYEPPRVDAPVLAVDLPSGVDADTGELLGEPLRATRTLALGALKWAHVDGPAASYCGDVALCDLGVEVPRDHGLLEPGDLEGLVPRAEDDHKWRHAVQVVAGSTPMSGAAHLACEGALAAGASLVLLLPRSPLRGETPREVVETSSLSDRVSAFVVGPGLGPRARSWLSTLDWPRNVPMVLDADALRRRTVAHFSGRPLILTPHEGEFVRLNRRPLPPRRVPEVVDLAASLGATVLLKGPRTLVASPEGQVRVVVDSSPALATAGSGDLLAGTIGALLAYGHSPLEAAALGAELHGLAGATWPRASDFVEPLRRRRG